MFALVFTAFLSAEMVSDSERIRQLKLRVAELEEQIALLRNVVQDGDGDGTELITEGIPCQEGCMMREEQRIPLPPRKKTPDPQPVAVIGNRREEDWLIMLVIPDRKNFGQSKKQAIKPQVTPRKKPHRFIRSDTRSARAPVRERPSP